MSYIVVQNYNSSTRSCYCLTVSEDKFEYENTLGVLTLEQLGYVTISNGYKPVNFSVDRFGVVKTDCGDFSRFSSEGCAVVLAEFKSRAGRNIGYRLLSCASGAIVNMPTEDIVVRGESQNHPFLQNGIIRNKTVNCYKLHPYPVIEVGVKAVKSVSKKTNVPTNNTKEKKIFTKAQEEEIKKCRNHGINSAFLENPELSPEQMRVLWVSKSKGAISEAFARPELSVDIMKFYADRLMSRKIASECGIMLKHPELKQEQLVELYLCVCEGIDYSDLVSKSAVDIMVERKRRTEEFWGTSYKTSDDIYDKAIQAACKIKGF